MRQQRDHDGCERDGDAEEQRDRVAEMERETAALSRAPTERAIVIVVPIARPTMMTVTMYMTWLPMETAVMLAAPWNWPMIKRSAMP